MFWIVALLIGGALCELGGLVTVARDVSEAAAMKEEIAARSKTLVAANRHVVADWMSRATGDLSRRRKGVIAFGAGLAMQTAANLWALCV